jgi:UDP-N-acetylmuramate-alanine ligase
MILRVELEPDNPCFKNLLCSVPLHPGLDYSHDWSASMLQPSSSGGTDFVVVRGGRALGRVSLGLPGVHNVLNALAVVAALGTLAAAAAFCARPAVEVKHNTP